MFNNLRATANKCISMQTDDGLSYVDSEPATEISTNNTHAYINAFDTFKRMRRRGVTQKPITLF